MCIQRFLCQTMPSRWGKSRPHHSLILTVMLNSNQECSSGEIVLWLRQKIRGVDIVTWSSCLPSIEINISLSVGLFNPSNLCFCGSKVPVVHEKHNCLLSRIVGPKIDIRRQIRLLFRHTRLTSALVIPLLSERFKLISLTYSEPLNTPQINALFRLFEKNVAGAALGKEDGDS